MNKTFTELYKSLPGSWSEMKLKDFKRLDLENLEDLEGTELSASASKTLKILSRMLDISAEALGEFNAAEINKLTTKLNFFSTQPTVTKTSLKWKALEDITYNDFIEYALISQQPLENISRVIQIISVRKLDEEEINNLNMEDVFAGFFLLRQSLQKSTLSMLNRSAIKLVKIKLRNLISIVLQRLKRKKK
ncbi:MAG: hypothetical protein J0I41_00100 [Filimonas sp.]|nr:hypothetical protein [Filimonas sp.]